jgi:hypothetical protein
VAEAERRRLGRTIAVGDQHARGERRRIAPHAPQVAVASGPGAWWPSGGLVIHGEIGGDV